MIERELLRALTERFGTPLYVHDCDQLEARVRDLRSALPPGSRLFYSLKANPLPALAAELRRAGCDGAEISSEGELLAARSSGFEPLSILYSGPGKQEEELLLALAAGVRLFSAESWPELERLNRLAAGTGEPVEVLLRVNPPAPPRARLPMSGTASRFGFDPSALAGQGARLRAFHSLRIVGLHVYHGTQVPADGALAETFESGLRLAQGLAAALGFEWRIVDLGGGFPWPFATAGEGPGAGALRLALSAVSRYRQLSSAAEVWFESGRFLAASSGSLVTRVLEVRESGGRRFVIVDAGIHHLGGMSGLGRLVRPEVTLEVEPQGSAPQPQVVDVVGPLCTPLDLLACDVTLPSCEPGSLAVIPNAGAYGLTASLVAFLSRKPPAEVLHRKGVIISASRLRYERSEESSNFTRDGSLYAQV